MLSRERIVGGHWPPSSRQLRGRARLRVGTGSGTEQVGSCVEPDHARGLAIGRRDGGCLRRIGGTACVGNAAHRTGAVMRAMSAGLIGLTCRTAIAVTDRGGAQRIGGGDAGRPRCPDRCEYLHHQGNQDDGKEFSCPPAHSQNHPHSELPTNHAESPESRSGSRRAGAETQNLSARAMK
jgi:hypothetical protein